MDIPSQTKNAEKTPDTANTVQVFDCNSVFNPPKLEGSACDSLPASLLTLIDILARQAAREICNPKEGGLQ